MRAAPAVDYPVAVTGLWFDALAALLGCAVALPLGLVVGHLLGRSEPVWAALLLAVPAAWQWSRRAGTVAARAALALRWDGQVWSLRETGAFAAAAATLPGHCALMIDLGDWLLVRWSAAGDTRWLPLARRDRPPAWSAMRIALRWSARTADLAAGTDVAA